MKVGVKVTLKEGTDVGEIVRLYRSGDGKEKCMVKFGDEKPIKKRVTALKLYEEPARKSSTEENHQKEIRYDRSCYCFSEGNLRKR